MLHASTISVHPEVMTLRARFYLVVTCVQHLSTGAFCIAAPELFTSSSFAAIKAVAPLPFWGVLFGFIALVVLWATASASESAARLGLILSAAISAAWAGGFLAAPTIATPTVVIVWTALAAKDLIICRQPLRSPFEALVRATLDTER